VPTQNNNFLVPTTHPLPPKLKSELLPKLITRRAANRLSAREFQEASYFDNILVSTMRFLDALPAKTPNEKTQFMRGLPRIMPQFPKSVLEKKVLPALLEEMKDRDILALILTNIFAMIKAMPSGKRASTEKVVPRLREIFLVKPVAGAEKDTSRDAGLMVLLENMETAAQNCAGKEFRDHILPVLLLALESPTHSLVDTALQTLPHVLPVLDFSTIKNDLFPVIANGFAKTSSLAIKIRGLEAFYTLCGGTPDGSDDDLNGIGVPDKKASSSSIILDKFTIQEKVVPLLKGIKTKEPGVMMAVLRVFKQVGEVADSDYLAMEVLPLLWQFSLGPLLNLQQFQTFMALIKALSGKIEREQTRKLQDMGSSNNRAANGARSASARSAATSSNMSGLGNGEETDFETLVSGRKPAPNGNDDLMNDWAAPQPARSTNTISQYPKPSTNTTPTFSWQTPTPAPSQSMNSLRPAMQNQASRTVTPDHTLSSFATLTPASQWSQPLQPSTPSSAMPLRPAQNTSSSASTIDWSSAMNNSASAWGSQKITAPPTSSSTSSMSSFAIAPPPMSPQASGFGGMGFQQRQSQSQSQQQQATGQKSGLDKYQSLI
jgi:SCY1-like protein 2